MVSIYFLNYFFLKNKFLLFIFGARNSFISKYENNFKTFKFILYTIFQFVLFYLKNIVLLNTYLLCIINSKKCLSVTIHFFN